MPGCPTAVRTEKEAGSLHVRVVVHAGSPLCSGFGEALLGFTGFR